jgi:pilus assembly protein CpaC
VSDVRVPDRVAEVAHLHAEKIANLLRVRGHQQVQLQVKFAEVSRRGLREMSFNIFHQDEVGRYVAGMAGSGTPPNGFIPVPGTGVAGVPALFGPNQGRAFSMFFSGLPRFPFSAMVSLLESSGLAKILAEPTLVAMSGQEAKFLAGGEFAVPYSTTFGQTTIQWKQFGIILNFVPTVIDEGTLHLKLSAEVSDVDPARAVVIGGFNVPGLISRKSETTVRLGDGQSFAIAGLLSNRIRSQIDRVPLLGDLPVLGALFRSVDYRRDESELLVVVTARLAKPLSPHEMPPLPTDEELNDPNDFELFLLGSEDRKPPKAEEPMRKDRKAGEKGEAVEPARGKTSLRDRRGPSGLLGFIR